MELVKSAKSHAAAAVVLLVFVSTSAASVTECQVGECSFYNCVDDLVECGPGGYPIGYGLKYCRRFTAARGKFSPRGQQWVTETKACLERHVKEYVDGLETQGSSFPLTDGGCRALRKQAMDSHVACYTGGSVSVCSLPPQDWVRVMLAIHDAFGDAFLQTVKQSLLTLQDCASALRSVLSSTTYRFTKRNPLRNIFRRDAIPSDQDGETTPSEAASSTGLPASSSSAGSAESTVTSTAPSASTAPADYAPTAAGEDDAVAATGVAAAAWRRRRQAAQHLRKRLAAFLRIPERHVFVDVTKVGRVGDVYVDGPTHPMMDDDVHQMPSIEIAVHILDGDGHAYELAQLALAAVSGGSVHLQDTLPDEWQGSAVMVGAGAEAPPAGAATTSESSGGGGGFSGGQVAGIVVGTVVGTLVLAAIVTLMMARMSGYRVVRSQAESEFLARSQEPLLEERE